jgi:phage tail-like protein
MPTTIDFPALLPPHYARRDPSGVWTRVLAATGAVLDGLAADVDAFATLQDYLACDAKYLPYLAQKLGWALDTASPEALQRKMVGLVVPMYRERGTTQGIVDLLNLLLGIVVTIDEPWADGWRLGSGALGDSATLAPAPPDVEYTSPLPYTFYVRFPRALTSAERAAARALITFARRADTHPVLVEPQPQPTPWVLGRSRIGAVDAVGAGAQLVSGVRLPPAPEGFWSADTFARYAGRTATLTVVASASRSMGPLIPGARYELVCDVPVYVRQGNRSVIATDADFLLEAQTPWALTPARASALHVAALAHDSAAGGTLRISRSDADAEFQTVLPRRSASRLAVS